MTVHETKPTGLEGASIAEAEVVSISVPELLKHIDGEFAVLEATKKQTRERDANHHNRTVEEMLIDHGILYGQELILNGLKAFVIAKAADKSGLPDSFLEVLPRSETEA